MKHKLTFLAALGCLFALTLTTSCNKPEEKTVYATNKAGERLVERIDYVNGDTITTSRRLAYNSDGTLKTIKEDNGDRIYSFERNGNTLFMRDEDDDITDETSFDLNEKGWIVLDRGWAGNKNYHLTYDANGYLHDVFDGEELLWTFEWKEGNIVNEEVSYMPTQAKPSNIDWCALLQSWRHNETYDNTENLVELPSICLFWGFSEGYLGNKCKGLVSKKNNSDYTYKFDEDGFLTTIYVDGEPAYRITYLKK